MENKTIKSLNDNIQVDNNIPTLISYILCPYVQRSVIAFNVKQVPYARINIDLEKPPAWFTKAVPTGKVPALFVEGEVLFESAVINEFIDENYGARLQQKTYLERAKERAWISYVDELLVDQYKMLMSQNEESFVTGEKTIFKKLQVLGEITGSKYFTDNSFGLMDAAIAPLFLRLKLTPGLYHELRLVVGEDSKLVSWIDNLTTLAVVKDSVVDDFEKRFVDYFNTVGSYVFNRNMSTEVA